MDIRLLSLAEYLLEVQRGTVLQILPEINQEVGERDILYASSHLIPKLQELMVSQASQQSANAMVITHYIPIGSTRMAAIGNPLVLHADFFQR